MTLRCYAGIPAGMEMPEPDPPLHPQKRHELENFGDERMAVMDNNHYTSPSTGISTPPLATAGCVGASVPPPANAGMAGADPKSAQIGEVWERRYSLGFGRAARIGAPQQMAVTDNNN